jgi:4-diphosphocytidyl-2-C-methyl-D-erythritol kinase
MPRDWLHLPAFAKINLSLECLGRRPDGYWEIRTIYQTLALPDRLRLRWRGRSESALEVRVPGGGAPAGRANLLHRALALARRHLRISRGIEVELDKAIPVGSGLGGGSSNAAAALVGLLRLVGTPLPPEELHRWGAELGADVPFFFVGGTALGVGRGEEIYPLPDQPPAWCVLGVPPQPILTATAYSWIQRARLTPRRDPAKIADSRRRADPLWTTGNDFEPVVFARYPDLARMKAILRAAGARQAGLSGSGSSVYALFPQHRAAERAAARLATKMPGVCVLLVRTLGGLAYRKMMGVDEVMELA